MIKNSLVSVSKLCIFLIIALNVSISVANPIQLHPLTEKLNKILTDFNENLNIGIVVKNLTTGQVYYRRNADRYFTPASNQKLFTAFAALHYLGANFTYQTRIFANIKKIENGTLNDNVYLQFSGDPTLSLQQLEGLISFLDQAGIKRINGSIIVDDTAFDDMVMSPGTTWDDKQFCYGAPVSSLILEKNCVTALLKPASQSGIPAELILPAQPQFIRFINQTITTLPSITDCSLDLNDVNDSTYKISGCVKNTDGVRKLLMSIRNPHVYLESAISYLLTKHQITVTQGILYQKMNSSDNALAAAVSLPLTHLMTLMLKESDNLIANSLFKTIGSYYSHTSGSWKNGSEAIRAILAISLQIDGKKIMLVDGDGASRYNFVTPQQIMALLQKIYLLSNKEVIISALPISGLDGTLRDRMKDEDLQGKIHAKTGSLTGVSSLSGYIETKDKHIIAFTILLNGFVGSANKYRNLEDTICKAIYELG